MTQDFVQLPGYSVVGLIYKGKKTTVYRAIETDSQRSVVIKYLSQDYPSFGKLVQFRNQYTITKNLSIAGIVQPLGLAPLGNRYALIMEDVGGISLETYAQQYTLDLTDVLEIALQLADILHVLYQHRVIHKDIKPGNILIHPDSKQVNLIDFSIASLLPKETQTIQSPKSLEGTLAYLAPEQTGRMNRGIDYRTDFYGLGVTLYQLLSGQLPFMSNDPLELIHCHIAQIPTPVNKIKADVPDMIAAIVAKLMAKNAEDRYQSALGFKHDLEQCLLQWNTQNKIVEFLLAQRDLSDRFLIPEKLYGREAEVQTLLDAFERVSQGSSELMLVAGFSGIGKTAVVNEVHKPIVRQRGYFIKGKFDQFNRNIPFSAFVQAFRDLMGQLLSESDEALAHWKKRILDVVGDNGQVLIEVIPELEQVIGSQPEATDLSGAAAQNRFNVLFQKFIAVFTTPEHPLVMFLDDLQWADSASCNLMKVLMGESETTYLLLLGAYRDNEVFPAHPLMLTLGELEKQAAAISTITLTPLSLPHINQLVVETLSYPSDVTQPLTELIYQKTKGNPFFTTQFLKGLYEDTLIVFNADQGTWDYDFVQVQEAVLTDDVVAFMTSRLQKLPQGTQNALKLAACIGNQFDLETLAIVCESPVEMVATDLWAALREGLIIPMTEAYKFYQDREQEEEYSEEVVVGYRFLHDRVQQAAYSLIPDDHQKQAIHLQIGQLLLAHQSPSDREDNIFNILNHLMMGIEADPEFMPTTELVELSLLAGMKAKQSVAYQAAINYFSFGLSRLPQNAWSTHYHLTLSLNREHGECDYFLGQFESSETRLNEALKYINVPLDKAQIYDILMTQRITRGVDIQSSIDAGFAGLAVLGIKLPSNPATLELLTNQELQQVQRAFEQISPEALLELPPISDPIKRNCMKLLGSLWAASYVAGNTTLNLLTTLRAINLSLEYGQAEGSSFAYTCYGMVLAFQGDYEQAYRFGKVALKLDRTLHNPKFMGKNNNLFAHAINPYVRPLNENLPLYQEALVISTEVGDLIYGVWAVLFIIWANLLQGKSLAEVEEQSQQYLDYVHGFNDQNMLDIFQIQQKFSSSLLEGRTQENIWTYKGFMANPSMEQWSQNQFHHGINWYGFLALYRLYLDGNYVQAIQVSETLESTLPTNFGFFPVILYHLYYTLSLIAVYLEVDSQTQKDYWQTIQEQQKILKTWSQTCPSTFQHKYDLVAAEVARINGNLLEAMDHYDRAIAGAKEHEFVQEEALTHELTAKFYLAIDKVKVAAVYMQDAYYCYAHWGAKTKIDQLATTYPHLLGPILNKSITDSSFSGSISNSRLSTGNTTAIDLLSVVKASQALSGSIEFDRLLSRLMGILMENAGADSGCLILNQASDQQAEQWTIVAQSIDNSCELVERAIETSQGTPLSIIHRVRRSQKTTIINHVAKDLDLEPANYLKQKIPQSLFCSPILNQGKLIGILYLENYLATDAFTTDRVEILNLITTQAAISIENAYLYKTLDQKVQKRTEELSQALENLKTTQTKLVESEKMAALGGLVAGVAHEINTPIGTSITLASTLVDETQTFAEQVNQGQLKRSVLNSFLMVAEDSSQLMLSNLHRAGELIQSFKQIAVDQGNLETRRFNLKDYIKEVSLSLAPKLKPTPHQLMVKGETQLIIESCPGVLAQIITNLVMNSINHGYPGGQSGRLQWHIQSSVEHVTLTYQDDGCGISSDNLTKIFEPFFTTARHSGGTGLGLHIVYNLVTQTLQGAIEVESQVDQGTCFVITLPQTMNHTDVQ
ncbi:MAG: ATP-binding sensor histidine kinase [Cyanobacteria bacterium P01_F01_bin.150]